MVRFDCLTDYSRSLAVFASSSSSSFDPGLVSALLPLVALLNLAYSTVCAVRLLLLLLFRLCVLLLVSKRKSHFLLLQTLASGLPGETCALAGPFL
ncbi:uncharacterized protein IWZ02DRAFT_480516 [Phyllosticta citriasiana]|uniref:uncharacterized protein n=1 Tax=Phyllosticta citriasiana TaxID=595635 RepID=UPI0030FDECCB